MKSFFRRHRDKFIGSAIIVVFIGGAHQLNIYLDKKEEQELKEFGVKTIAQVDGIYNRKRGYDIGYVYFANGKKWRVTDNESSIPPGLVVGDCYPIIYSIKDPLVRKIDFSKKLIDLPYYNPFEIENMKELQKKCSCTSAWITERKYSENKRLLFKYHFRIDDRGYSRWVETANKVAERALRMDSVFLLLYSPDNYRMQHIFLNTPRQEISSDFFPTSKQCEDAISDLSKGKSETGYIY